MAISFSKQSGAFDEALEETSSVVMPLTASLLVSAREEAKKPTREGTADESPLSGLSPAAFSVPIA